MSLFRARGPFAVCGLALLLLGITSGSARGQALSGPLFPRAVDLPDTADVLIAPVRVATVAIRDQRTLPDPSSKVFVRGLRTQTGAVYDASTVQEDQRLLSGGARRFGDVRSQVQALPDGRVEVSFILRDLPGTIRKIEYRGARRLTNEQLNRIAGLYLGMPPQLGRTTFAPDRIVGKYREELGHPFATCSIVKGHQPDEEEILFQIDEGPRITISDIRFVGRTFATDATLARQIRSSKKWLGLFGGNFSEGKVKLDEIDLGQYYRAHGYLDARVSSEVRYLPDGENASVEFHVQEGVRYRIKGKLLYSSTAPATSKELEQLMTLKECEHFDLRRIKGIVKKMEDHLRSNGITASVGWAPIFHQGLPGFVTVEFEVR
jgi:outer membrane protein insertion porin family